MENSVLKTPNCDICKKTFLKLEYLNTHMKYQHGETDSMRLERLTKRFELKWYNKDTKVELSEPQLKSYDCTECGELFVTNKEQNNHNEKHHDSKGGCINENEESECEDGKNDLSIKSENYEIREYPDNKQTENIELDKVFGKKAKLD